MVAGKGELIRGIINGNELMDGRQGWMGEHLERKKVPGCHGGRWAMWGWLDGSWKQPGNGYKIRRRWVIQYAHSVTGFPRGWGIKDETTLTPTVRWMYPNSLAANSLIPEKVHSYTKMGKLCDGSYAHSNPITGLLSREWKIKVDFVEACIPEITSRVYPFLQASWIDYAH